jgi:hypothetical protein
MRSPTVILNDDQIGSFRKNGFLALGAISSPQELPGLRRALDRLLKTKAGYHEGAQYDLVGSDRANAPPRLPQIMNPGNYARELRNTLFHANALAIARQLLGKQAEPFFEHAILKPPLDGAATPWHQDEAYRRDPNFDYKELSVWMPLQDATLENGCMQFIPGTNLGDVLPHRSVNNDPRIHALECCGKFNAIDAVICALPAGGCTIHDGRTLHYAGPNRSAAERWAYILTFDLPPKPRTDKRKFPWNDKKDSSDQVRKRIWLRRGGIVVELWRTLRRGLPKSPGRIQYLLRRSWSGLFTNSTKDDH